MYIIMLHPYSWLWLWHMNIFCSNMPIVIGLGYEWHFMLSFFKFLHEKKNYFKLENDRFQTWNIIFFFSSRNLNKPSMKYQSNPKSINNRHIRTNICFCCIAWHDFGCPKKEIAYLGRVDGFVVDFVFGAFGGDAEAESVGAHSVGLHGRHVHLAHIPAQTDIQSKLGFRHQIKYGPYVLSGGPLIFTFSFFSQSLLVSMKIFDLPRTEEEAVRLG